MLLPCLERLLLQDGGLNGEAPKKKKTNRPCRVGVLSAAKRNVHICCGMKKASHYVRANKLVTNTSDRYFRPLTVIFVVSLVSCLSN